jgi:hypothetical protein
MIIEKQAAQQRLLEQQRIMEHQRLEHERLRLLEQDRLRLLQDEQMRQQQALVHHQSLQNNLSELENQLRFYKEQAERDKGMIEVYDRRMKAMEDQLSKMSLQNQEADESKDDFKTS